MTAKEVASGSVVIPSRPSAISRVYTRILSGLRANNYTQEDIFAVHLSVEEAFLNAVKHGNKMDSSKEVKVEYYVDGDKIELRIFDQGSGFNPEDVPEPRVGENLYRTEGRGLLLMRAYMDVVEYNEQGNCIHMIRYKKRPAQPAKQS